MYSYGEGVMSTTEDIIWPDAENVPYTSRWRQRLCRWFGHRKQDLSTLFGVNGEPVVEEWQCRRCYLRTLPFGANMRWYEYIRTQYLCPNCRAPLKDHANGQCLYMPGMMFDVEDYLVHQLLLQEGEDSSQENVKIQKQRIVTDLRKGIL